MRRLSLRYLIMRLGLDSVHEVGELDRILDEEDGDVVADEIPVALVRVELGGEAAHIANGVGASARALHRTEAREDGRGARGIGKDASVGVLLGAVVKDLEITVGSCASSVDLVMCEMKERRKRGRCVRRARECVRGRSDGSSRGRSGLRGGKALRGCRR